MEILRTQNTLILKKNNSGALDFKIQYKDKIKPNKDNQINKWQNRTWSPEIDSDVDFLQWHPAIQQIRANIF